MPEIITSAIREIGCALAADGWAVAVGVDRDAVTITVSHARGPVALDAAQREHFQRLFMQAEREAEAWATEHAGAGDG